MKRYHYLSEPAESLDLEPNRRLITPLIGLVYVQPKEQFIAYLDEKNVKITLSRSGRLIITGPSISVCKEEFERIKDGLAEILGKPLLYNQLSLIKVRKEVLSE